MTRVSPMHTLRRVTALALSVLLVQAPLGEIVARCADHAQAAVRGDADDHAGTAMDPVSSTASSIGHMHAAYGDSHDGCSSTPLSPTGCSMLGSCLVQSIPTAGMVAIDGSPSESHAWADPNSAHPSPVAAPELPPPRV